MLYIYNLNSYKDWPSSPSRFDCTSINLKIVENYGDYLWRLLRANESKGDYRLPVSALGPFIATQQSIDWFYWLNTYFWFSHLCQLFQLNIIRTHKVLQPHWFVCKISVQENQPYFFQQSHFLVHRFTHRRQMTWYRATRLYNTRHLKVVSMATTI